MLMLCEVIMSRDALQNIRRRKTVTITSEVPAKTRIAQLIHSCKRAKLFTAFHINEMNKIRLIIQAP